MKVLEHADRLPNVNQCWMKKPFKLRHLQGGNMLRNIFILVSVLTFSASAQFFDLQEAPKAVYGGVGIGVLQNLDASEPAYQAFLGKYWSLGEYFALNTAVEAVSDFDQAWYLDGIVGVNYYPFSAGFNSISPYVGGGLGLGWATDDGDGDYGLNLSATAGFLLFRGRDIEVMVEGNFDWLSSEIIDGNPAVWTGRIGLLF